MTKYLKREGLKEASLSYERQRIIYYETTIVYLPLSHLQLECLEDTCQPIFSILYRHQLNSTVKPQEFN